MSQKLSETTFCGFRVQTLIVFTTIDDPKPKRDAISKTKFTTVVGNDDESQWVSRLHRAIGSVVLFVRSSKGNSALEEGERQPEQKKGTEASFSEKEKERRRT